MSGPCKSKHWVRVSVGVRGRISSRIGVRVGVRVWVGVPPACCLFLKPLPIKALSFLFRSLYGTHRLSAGESSVKRLALGVTLQTRLIDLTFTWLTVERNTSFIISLLSNRAYGMFPGNRRYVSGTFCKIAQTRRNECFRPDGLIISAAFAF